MAKKGKTILAGVIGLDHHDEVGLLIQNEDGKTYLVFMRFSGTSFATPLPCFPYKMYKYCNCDLLQTQ